jgi:Ca2+-binding RTX toxin-like protein
MNIRSRLVATPVGVAASATLALGAVAALPAHLAFADPESAPSASVANDTLSIDGTNGPDVITVGVGADPSTLRVDLGTGATPLSFARSTFSVISVSLALGDDTFSVDPQGQFSDKALVVNGGGGDNRISGSRGNDVLFAGAGDDTMRGNDGNDLIISGAGDDDVNGNRGTDVEILGAGADTARWIPGEGNDIVDGGGGHDRLAFDGSDGNETFTVTANGSRELLTRSLGTIRMDLDSVEQIDLATLGGTDRVTVGDLSRTRLRTVNVDLSSARAADGLLDTVVVDGTDHPDHVTVGADDSTVDVSGLHAQTHISGADTRDQLQVSTGDGNDTVGVSDAAAALIGVTVDLGNDQH